jgi:hypothetical protein
VVIMALALFVIDWHGAGRDRGRSIPGSTIWQSTTDLRWGLLLTIVLGAAAVVAQAAFRAPAIPSTVDVITIVVAAVAVLVLVYKVVLHPGEREQFGAWLELIGALGLLGSSFLALRQEGIRTEDGPGEIPLVNLARPTAGRPGPS